MSLLIELPPKKEAQVTALANEEGVSLEILLCKALDSYQREKFASKSHLHSNSGILELQKQWKLEDAKLSPEEREKENTLFAELEREGISRMKVG